MATDARRTLVDALEKKGWSLTELHARAKPGCSRASLHRKLYGYRKPGTKKTRIFQSITAEEFRRLAGALDALTDDAAASLDQIEHLGLRGAA
jgi:hypothetical protein